ncbi:ABC transporter ATP-binding protein [Saccharopolyspora sp. CA-218241]|uniref:ABC transporter ATP-binding protein n=1 Tax=Saccharopolyspora sp. CA-218241 TaxID=3240027 RepID=UPI003D995BA5
MTGLLRVRDLSVHLDGGVSALRGVDLDLDRGGTLVVLGESGAGKSTLARCMAGLVPEATGSVRLGATELVGASEEVARPLRGEVVAVALAGAPMHPLRTLGDSIGEPLRVRRGLGRRRARDRAEELARECGLDPSLLHRYPHEVSGGQRRRAALAGSLALDPDLLVLDEPTAGLDPVAAAALTEQLASLSADRGTALLVITHDLGAAARLGGRTVVLYAGAVAEHGPTADVLRDPAHPYAAALIAAYPTMSTTRDLRPVRGVPPDPRALPPGCAFRPRCAQAEEICAQPVPGVVLPGERQVACHLGGRRTLLEVTEASAVHGRGRAARTAVDAVSFALRSGEAVGLTGPSGSGKTTLARVIAGAHPAAAGRVALRGTALPLGRADRPRIQLVAQDPRDSVSPRMTVREVLREPLDVLGEDGDLTAALTAVGLPASRALLDTIAHRLSGGQLQRLSVARAMLAGPELLVADEPTSLLDPSEQARMILVLRERQVESGLGLLLVSHDLALLRKVCDRVLVLDDGRLVEQGSAERICTAPASRTARRLIAASSALSDRAGASAEPDRHESGGTTP